MKTRKKIVLGILIVYLLTLAGLTFFSDHMLKKQLPEVEAVHVTSGTVNDTYYNKTVPLSAVYSDEKGQCLFEIVIRETPLGKRYYLNRVDAVILETDAGTMNTAVESVLSHNSLLVKDCSVLPEACEMVRVKDESHE